MLAKVRQIYPSDKLYLLNVIVGVAGKISCSFWVDVAATVRLIEINLLNVLELFGIGLVSCVLRYSEILCFASSGKKQSLLHKTLVRLLCAFLITVTGRIYLGEGAEKVHR